MAMPFETRVDTQKQTALWLFAVFTILFGWHAGLSFFYTQPYIFGDELTYKSMAFAYFREGNLYAYTSEQIGHAADLPNFLYQLLISPAFVFGDSYLDAIKLINALMVASALFPLFLLLREFVSEGRALFAAAIALLLPELNYTINVMPENLFLPLFLWSFYLSFRALYLRSWRYLFLSATASGLLYLTKPHAIAFVAALYLLMGILIVREAVRHNKGTAVRYLVGGAVHFAAMAAVVVLVNATFSSQPLWEFGSYSNMANDMLNKSLFEEFGPFIRMVAAHLGAIALLYFLPVGAALVILFRGIRADDVRRYLFAALLLLSFVVFLAMVIKFTHVISGQEHYERLHQRYYYFLFPLLISALFIHHAFIKEHRALLLGLFVLMVPLIYAFLYASHVGGNVGFVTDAPGLVWLLALHEVPWLAAVAAAVYCALMVYILLGKRSLQGYGALLIVYVAFSNLAFVQAGLRLHHANALHDYDVTQKIAQSLSGYGGKVAVIDSSFQKRMNLVFWTDLHYTAVRQVPTEQLLTPGLIGDADAVVLLDDYRVEFEYLRAEDIECAGRRYRILYVNHVPKENLDVQRHAS